MEDKPKNLFNIFSKEHDRLVLWIPVLFGIGIGIYYLLPYEPDIWVISGFCSLFALLTALFWNKSAGRLVFIAGLLVSLGILRAEISTQSAAAPILQEEVFFRSVQGNIDDIQIREKGEKLILSNVEIDGFEESETPKRISVSLKKVEEGLNIGDKIQLNATLFPPPTPVLPKAYDFSRMFYYEQLGAVGYSPRQPVILEKARENDFDDWLNGKRLALTERILAPMSPENGWVASALMVGEMSGIAKDTADVMRESGIYHVLSISGLHMSLAAMLVFVTVRFLLTLYPPLALRVSVKKIAAFVALLSSFIYLLLAGYPVPAVRSFVMVAVVMLAILCDRSGISVFSLAWAAVIVLLWQPESLLGASFQLSFAATLAILTIYERYGGALYSDNIGFTRRIWIYFFGIMLTSLVATLATTPLVIYHFNRFTLWGIAANMLLLPLVSMWIMPAAVIVFLAMPFNLEYYPLIVLDQGISFMMQGARFFAELPYASIALPSPHFYGLLLFITGGLWLCIWQHKWRLLGIPLAIIGVATIGLHKPYDLLISSDASKVALRLDDGRFVFLRGKEDSFDGQVWLRAHGQENAAQLDDLDKNIGSCDKYKCVMNAYGKKIVVTKGKKEIENSCLFPLSLRGGETDEAIQKNSEIKKNGLLRHKEYVARNDELTDIPDIVISRNYLGDIDNCAAVPLLIDAEYLQEKAATALRFHNGETQIESSSDYRGDRPWVNSGY
ncbi:MAG: ComEC/Rec2 family competence protein [Pseudomonadota bacterium]|mgnify:CR=1 FL=1